MYEIFIADRKNTYENRMSVTLNIFIWNIWI